MSYVFSSLVHNLTSNVCTAFYPCRCLWRAFSQITRTMPLRRMTEHLGQILRTDERTFMCFYFHSYSSDIRTNTKLIEFLFEPVGDPTSGQIIGGKFHCYLVAGKYFYKVHPHLTRYVCQYFMAILHFHPEHSIRECFKHRALYLYGIFFCHILTISLSVSMAHQALSLSYVQNALKGFHQR